MGTYKYLEDIEELEWFYKNVMQRLKGHECWFLSASARNKRLSEEERKTYQLGRSEMFASEVVSEEGFDKYLRAVRRLEANVLAYTTKSGVAYPDKVLVLYANICPSDAYRAMLEQTNKFIEIQKTLTDGLLKGSKAAVDAAFYSIRHSHTIGHSVFARSFSEGEWVDVDCDVDTTSRDCSDTVLCVLGTLLEQGDFVVIETVGGYHCFLKKTALKTLGANIKGDPIKAIVDKLDRRFKELGVEVREIVKNVNEMCPLPGTLQYGEKLVRVVNKYHFE